MALATDWHGMLVVTVTICRLEIYGSRVYVAKANSVWFATLAASKFNPLAKSHEHRRDAVSTGQGYQKFRTLAASGENGPPLLPSKFRRVLQVGI